MEIYYQVEVNQEGVVVGINSSDKPFNERQITLEQLKLIKIGQTKY